MGFLKFITDTNPFSTDANSGILQKSVYVGNRIIQDNLYFRPCTFFTALCGPNERIFTDKPEIITSPSYPSPYPLDVICRWRVSGADPFGAYFIRFMDLDLKDSPQCNDDFVEITDLNVSFIIINDKIKDKSTYIKKRLITMFFLSIIFLGQTCCSRRVRRKSYCQWPQAKFIQPINGTLKLFNILQK